MDDGARVAELQLALTPTDCDQALRSYRDVLGLPERTAYASPAGRVTIPEAGCATLELTDPLHRSATQPG